MLSLLPGVNFLCIDVRLVIYTHVLLDATSIN